MKKTVLKKYTSLIAIELYTEIIVNGKKKSLSFEGGKRGLKPINGTFITADPEIQKAIENSPSYGKKFKLIGKVEEKSEEGGGNDETIIEDITTGAQAKEYLIRKHGIQVSKLPNMGAIKNVASQVNVSFPNLK